MPIEGDNEPATKHVVACETCSWKVVTRSPDRDLAGHRQRTGIAGMAHIKFRVEPHEEGHPTMPHADAERIGHCWHADAEREDKERERDAAGK